jgi:hypothetical protein
MNTNSNDNSNDSERKMERRKISKIEVSFPVPVIMPAKSHQKIADCIDNICKLYEIQNPTRVMWPFGFGSKPKYIWEAIDDGEQVYDDSVFYIEVAEREDYKITEAPQVDDVRDHAAVYAQQLRGANCSLPELDIQLMLQHLVNQAYAIGLKDGIGSDAAKLLRTQLRSVDLSRRGAGVCPTFTPELRFLTILAKRQAEQKTTPTKVLIIHPHEIADLAAGGCLDIGQGTFGETYIKYMSPEDMKAEEEDNN